MAKLERHSYLVQHIQQTLRLFLVFFKLADIRRDLVLHLEVFVLDLGHTMSDRRWQSLTNAPLVTLQVNVPSPFRAMVWFVPEWQREDEGPLSRHPAEPPPFVS